MNRSEKTSKIQKICVYCGSGPGTDPAFVEAAEAFGAILAKNDIRLIFGGGSVGMMGTIAKSVLDHGGAVTGGLRRERPRRGDTVEQSAQVSQHALGRGGVEAHRVVADA